MARKKVKLQWIANDSARKATFKKRKKGLIKKVSELSTLCGVSACAIVYGPYEAQPEVWPSHSDAHRVLTRFKSLPDMDQNKKMMNQESFLRERIAKLKEKLKKQQRENRGFEVARLMNQVLAGRGLRDLGMELLNDLIHMVDDKSKVIQERVEELSKGLTVTVEVAHPPPPPPPPPPMPETAVANDRNGAVVGEKTDLDIAMDAIKRQPWFMDVMNPQGNVGGGVHDNNVNVLPPYSAPPHADYASWTNGFFH